MIHNCNKIRFITLVTVMLLSTINVWSYNVTFDENGGSACTDISTTGEIKLPNSTKNGMFLTGWYDGDGNASNLIGYVGLVIVLFMLIGQKWRVARLLALVKKW